MAQRPFQFVEVLYRLVRPLVERQRSLTLSLRHGLGLLSVCCSQSCSVRNAVNN